MRDMLILLAVGTGYTLAMIFAGIMLEKNYVVRILPEIQSRAYVRGVVDCQQYESNQRKRDQLQGVPHGPEKITVGK